MESWTAGLKITAAEMRAGTKDATPRYLPMALHLDGRDPRARAHREFALGLLTEEERAQVSEWGLVPALVYVDQVMTDIRVVVFRRACERCGGSGYLPEHAGVDGGRCWSCFTSGYATGTRGTVRTYREFARIEARNAAARARRAKEAEDKGAALEASIRRARTTWRAQGDHDAVLTGLEALSESSATTSAGRIAADLLRQFQALAMMSDPQLELARRLVAEAAAKAALVASGAQLAEGRQVITGMITWSKIQDTEVWAGYRWVTRTQHRIAVKTAEGFTVWLTVPDAAFGTVDTGTRIKVTVTVSRGKSPIEGNGSRPTKLEVLAPEAVTAA